MIHGLDLMNCRIQSSVSTSYETVNAVIQVVLSPSVGKLPQRSSLWALSLSLSAVNLSESAQGKMAPAQLTQIYVTAATALRTLLGHHLSFLPVCLFTDPSSVLGLSHRALNKHNRRRR